MPRDDKPKAKPTAVKTSAPGAPAAGAGPGPTAAPVPPKKAAGRWAPEDVEFMSDTSAAFLQRTPRGGRLILWAAILFFGSAFAWANYAELDEVTTGSGTVVPSRQVQVVQNLEGGIVAELLVNEGDVVDVGQVLLRIDDTRFASSYQETHTRFLSLQAKAARLRAEFSGEPFQVPEEAQEKNPALVARELALLRSRREELGSSVSILKQQITQRRQELAELRSSEDRLKRSFDLVNQELTMTRPLVPSGAISEVEVLRLERQASELRGELEATRHAIPRVQSRRTETERKIEETRLGFRNNARAEFNETMAELSGLSASSTALEDRVTRTAVRSPVRGTVKQLLVNTVGGVVQPGMDLLEIVPLEDTLLVEAKVRPADIAFLRPGQKGVVKFTAYDFAIYGGLDAKLERISADTITDEKDETFYQVLVRTERNFLGEENDPLPLIPGMLAEVDILTGKKTVLNYILKPVLRAKERAFRER